MTASHYWYLAKEWKLDHMKLTPTQAEIAWNKLKLVIMQMTKKKAEELKDMIKKGSVGVDHGDQLSLM